MLNTPFPPWPSFSEQEIEAVAAVLRSGRVNSWTGVRCREFETAFAEWVGVPHAIALANGTLALELALRALDLRPGDEVVVTPRSFIASVSCVLAVGATPVFADVDADTQNITAGTIAAVLTPRTRAVIPVHLAGMPCDLDPIMTLARDRSLFVVEDCAQAHGARYKDRMVGSVGDIGAWSFCQDKIMTTGGEGGMVTTSSRDLWLKLWSLKEHGKSWDAVHQQSYPPGFRWLHQSFGTNGRMLELQAALGSIQLGRMADWSAIRRRHAEAIWATARKHRALRVPEVPPWATHAAYKAYVFVESPGLRPEWTRDRIIAEIVRRGVPCYAGTCAEIYNERAFDTTGWRPAAPLPVARRLGDTSMMFLVHPTIGRQQIDQTCATLDEVMAQASL